MSDVDELRALAARVRELADQARDAAAQLRRAQGVRFVSDAAERYRDRLRGESSGADGAARELDEAAQALTDHAAHVEATLERIRSVERWFGDRVRDAQRELGEAVDGVSDAASSVVDLARRAPLPGSPDWLDFGRRWMP